MGLFNKKLEAPHKQIDRAQKSGTDKRIYGDLLYRCRRCGYEGVIKDVPDIDKVAYALMNGNTSHVFMSTNFFLDENTNTTYRECQHHECSPGKIGYMELIGADIKGQIYLAEKYKKHDYTPTSYNPDEEIPLENIFPDIK